MTALPLGEWEILDLPPGAGVCAELAGRPDGWIRCPAPGDTYLALHEAGRLAHPLADENEVDCAWVKDREWWWRTTFAAAPAAANERVLLDFAGLDTYADIWLDGERLGSSDNMFVAARFDVGRHLRDGAQHVLLVRFTPPAVAAADKSMPSWPIADPIRESKRNFHRKAQFGWGWDWGPQLPTVGIWQAARLIRQRIAAIDDVGFSTIAADADAAEVAVTVSLDVFAAGAAAVTVHARLVAPDGNCVAEARLDDGDRHATLHVDRPQLWWTPELGASVLHRLEVTAWCGDALVDSSVLQVGIRRIELDTSPDPGEPGCDFFRFVLNGVPLFARGTNWIPASSFVGAVGAADYTARLQSVVDANMNMVRVWGGGVYEGDAFYETCDRLGLLVWQDFMFASAPYPDHDEDFVRKVREEVAHQVRRLRHHASLALWCGNNECQCAHELLDYMAGTTTPYAGESLFAEIIPSILQRLDPATPYWPSSPYGGPMLNSMRSGDVHNWTVWHGLPPIPDDTPVGEFKRSPATVQYSRYAEDRARFVSEFGIQASPARSTLARWVAPERLSLDSPAFLNRIKDHPKDKINAMLLPMTGLPADLDQYVEFTQLVQAEGLKFGIEHYRRRKPHCSGTLIWQHNDCWPGVSWSLIDHDGVRKASWYYVARAYAPLMAAFRPLDGGEVELWVTNDTLGAVQVEATVSLLRLDGIPLWRREIAATVAGNAAGMVWRIDRATLAASAEHVLVVRSPQFPANRLLFAPFKNLALSPADPTLRLRPLAGGGIEAVLEGRGYHHFVHLLVQDASARFSDNYFDLCAGETRTIEITAQHPLHLDDVCLRAFHPKAGGP
ncbi:glycoside hydrolase family 2 protein [Solimonas terrae]|uniref:Beta-mannosidase B n=1 Tax=Solimonas terrae TaxID=1396819 RepID=A0A6M2BUC4_9GAMM|nr:glycoside hydrolase family 2 protein [Solimonas terrae]NGY05579.1 glycoside hydrolase family 2 protein [Solimonas terrae]